MFQRLDGSPTVDASAVDAAATGRRSSRGASALLQAGSIALSLAAPRIVRSVSRGRTPRLKTVLATAAMVGGANAVTAAMERRTPFREQWNESVDDDVRLDVTYIGVQGPLVGAAVGLVSHLVLAPSRRSGGAARGSLWPCRAPLAARVLLALAVAELPHYWWHRLSHGVGWRWHAVHHSANRLYWLNATRVHALDMFVDVLGLTLPLRMLGIDADASLATHVFRGTYGKVQHSNVAGGSGVLNLLFSTPELHRWHHSLDPRRGFCNFGASLIVWDRIFGTCSAPDRQFGDPIGVDDPEYPTTWSGQFAAPLRRQGDVAAGPERSLLGAEQVEDHLGDGVEGDPLHADVVGAVRSPAVEDVEARAARDVG